MSNEAMAWAFAQPIPPAPKMVLLALANNANKNGTNCFPSIKLIVENCVPMKVRTVQYHLKWLAEEAKLITITPWFQSTGRQTSNLYELRMTTTYCSEGAESCTGEGAESCTGRVQKVAPLLNLKNLNLRKIDPKKIEPKKKEEDCAQPSAVAVVARRYAEAYRSRYKADPVLNAKVNGQLSQLVKRIGGACAPEVAAFYVWHNDYMFVRSQHAVGLLLRDCEGLHTQWVRGSTVTSTQAQRVDQQHAKAQMWRDVAAEFERERSVVHVQSR